MRSPSKGRAILVSNAGTHPELSHGAAALVGAGYPVVYFSSLSWSASGRAFASMPKSLRASTFANRWIPRLDPRSVKRRAWPWEIAFQAAKRLPMYHPGLPARVLTRRNRAFDAAVGKAVSRLQPRLVIGQSTGVRDTLKLAQSMGIPTILNCPIAHHRWMAEYLRAEADRNPTWAGALQHVDLSGDWAHRLDEEIAAADYLLTASSFCAQTYAAFGVPAAKLLRRS